MHQPWRIATYRQHARDQLFFADVAFAYMLNLNPGFGADLMRTITNPVTHQAACPQ